MRTDLPGRLRRAAKAMRAGGDMRHADDNARQNAWANTCDLAAKHLETATSTGLLRALMLVEQHFRRNWLSGNFQGDDEHEVWTAVRAVIERASVVEVER